MLIKHFIIFGSLFSFSSLVRSETCPYGIRQRKELRNLSLDEWDRFAKTVKAIQSGPAPTKYDSFTNIHVTNKDFTHNYPLFLTWHRYFIREFEKALQEIDPTVMLPYWHWAYDSQAPEASIAFDNQHYGGNGVGQGNCVQNGQFAGWQPYYPSPHCLTRKFDSGNHISGLYSTEIINQITATSNHYDDLRQGIEFAPHGAVHNNIGADMATMHSVNDPIFFPHHAYVDKIWDDWQKLEGKRTDYSGTNRDGSAAKSTDTLPGYGSATVNDTFYTEPYCYTYADLVVPLTNNQNSTTPLPQSLQKRSLVKNLRRRADQSTISLVPDVPADDRENLVLLRKPNPITQDWSDQNGIEVERVREYERKYAKIIHTINSIDDYTSPSTYWLREDLVYSMVVSHDTTEYKFHAEIRGKTVDYTVKKDEMLSDTYGCLVKLKNTVRSQCGGSVRGDASRYKPLLEKTIGKWVLSKKSLACPYTIPLRDPAEKVKNI